MDYPARFNAMLEELRYTKERNRALEIKLRQEESSSKQHLEQIVRQEEALRELRGKRKMLISKNGEGGEVNKPYHVRF